MTASRRTRLLPTLPAAFLVSLILGLIVGLSAPAQAQGRQLIRDAEIEHIVRAYATPLFQAAGLNPQAIDVYLVQDPTLNAFVSGGQNIFIHTGLIMASEDPLQLIGVIAHETGHIAGGHIAGRIEGLKTAQNQIFLTYALGLAAAIATGQPGLAAVVLAGGQDVALKGLLTYSRSQEQAADQAGISYLEATEQSPRGTLEFMQTLGGQEIFLSSTQDPYLRTHPLTRDRILFLEDQVKKSPYRDKPASPEFVTLHKRMLAKLVGFLEPINKVYQTFPAGDDSLEARYAQSIAEYRRPDLQKGLELIDSLLADYPDDPYFHELRGQMLFENGKIREAVPAYQRAVDLLPGTSQLTLGLAKAQVEANDPAFDDDALAHLQTTLDQEPQNAAAWRLAAIVYGRRGDTGMTALSLAEAALARRSAKEAQGHARRAQNVLPVGSPGWLRAQDVENLALQVEAKQNR